MQSIDEVKIKTSHYIIGAIGVVTAIAWKDSMKNILYNVLPTSEEIKIGFLNALIMTIILILTIMLLPNSKKALPSETQAAIDEKNHDTKIENLTNKIRRLEYFILTNRFIK